MNDPELNEIRRDYIKLLDQINITQEQVDREVFNQADLIPMPSNWIKTCVKKSPIHGQGIFALTSFNVGEIVAPLNINGKRTPAGRYTNHSPKPNIRVEVMDTSYVAIAAKNIAEGEEITLDYREPLKLIRGLTTD